MACALETLKKWIQKELLPTSYLEMSQKHFFPLAEDIHKTQSSAGKRPWIVGVNGSQGSGKSTLCGVLEIYLTKKFGLKCVTISIDDLYKTKAERAKLAKQIHPLLKTRGVPGTHDVKLGIKVFSQLMSADSKTITKIPRFDKATDDRAPIDLWDVHIGETDVLLFEGWCVGTTAQNQACLNDPINSLEKEEDPHCIWRNYVNEALKHEYKEMFATIDQLVLLKVPSFECVYQWRQLQEEKLRRKLREGNFLNVSTNIMSREEVIRFIQHYERLTIHNLKDIPNRADWIFSLNKDHEVYQSMKRKVN